MHSECLLRDVAGDPSPFGVPAMKGDAYEAVLRRPGPMFQGLLVNSRAMDKARPLDVRLVAYQEWDTSIRLAKHFEFGFMPEPTFIYETGGTDSISSDKSRSAQGYEQVVRKHQKSILRHCGRGGLIEHYVTIQRLYREAGDAERERKARLKTRALSIPDVIRPRPH